ncbi:MAG: type I polyketide synthase, partial [Planctomycetes bacterium]|nr:type I polyketide synthase [Planctomycetota bacterium]
MDKKREILVALKEKRISIIEAKNKIEKTLEKDVIHSPSSKNGSRFPSSEDNNYITEPIAIIGMSGRFPGAKDIQEFWLNLERGVDSVKEIPKDRWDIDQYFDPEPGKIGKIYSRCAGLLDNIDQFDPLFFNISPREAEQMDPQYRLLLQETWKSIEDAGCKASSLSGKKVGLFIAGGMGDYLGGSVQLPSTEAGRISYLFDWKGPCICIETTCSSGLVALHEACIHIQTGQLEMAIVGGVSLMITPSAYLGFSKISALSKKGRCFPFDKRADGTIFSENVCSIVLKPFSAALVDHHHIYGIIKGSGINYDGKTNGLTAPSMVSQIQLETEVYRKFNINPEQISMVEAHGTGTRLGDPIEANALIKSFNQFTRKKSFCALGSVKSNIGHTGPPSGLVGLIKVLLSLKHKKIPPTKNYQELNPSITLKDSPFYINTTLKDWTTSGLRMAAVSSFGFSGTNAHVVVQEYSSKEVQDSKSAIVLTQTIPFMIPLSAKKPDRLKVCAENLLQFIQIDESLNSRIDLKDLAYTLQVGREAMESRLAIIVDSIQSLDEKLKNFIDDKEGIADLYLGQVKQNKDNLDIFTADEDMSKIINIWLSKKKYNKVLGLWVK